MKINTIITSFLLVFPAVLLAQSSKDTIDYSLNARMNPGTGYYAPFLSTANEYDRHSFTPNSLSFWGDIHKPINFTQTFDYGFGMEWNGNLSKLEKRFFPGELYVQGKAWFMNITVGMKKEVFGNQDSELSSGGLIWSRNSRSMPRIAIQSNDYLKVPFTKGYLEVKGGVSHGWFMDSTSTRNTLLHHKYGYIRLGGSLPVNLSFGLQHVCQWAGSSLYYGESPVSWNNYKRVFLGRNGDSNSSDNEKYNALGNHILSQNLGLDVHFKVASLALYWQNISEDGPIKRMDQSYNAQDGLWGLSVKIPTFKPLSHFVVEYLSTTDQSGPWHDLDGVIYGGTDSYYNNGVYPDGWSYYDMGIGNPYLTSPRYNTNGAISFTNNKVRAYYFSGVGAVGVYSYRAMVSNSSNFGSPSYTYPADRKQISCLVEVSRPLSIVPNTSVSLGVSADKGDMYGNNFAVLLGVRYSGLFNY